MKIPTYSESKGRHVSRGIIYATGNSFSENGRHVHPKGRTSTNIYSSKKATITKLDRSQKPLPNIIGKIKGGYVLENAIVLTLDHDIYVGMCKFIKPGEIAGVEPIFIKAYTRCKETAREYCSLSKIIREHQREIKDQVRHMAIGGFLIGEMSWDTLYQVALKTMNPYEAKGNKRVSEVAARALSKSATVKRHKTKTSEKLEKANLNSIP